MSSYATLTTLRDRAEELLTDSANAIFSTTLLAECVRLALEEYSLARPLRGAHHSLSGLDSATLTTFPIFAEGTIVLGAAAYACFARAGDLNETAANMGVSTPNYGTLGEAFYVRFRARLEVEQASAA